MGERGRHEGKDCRGENGGGRKLKKRGTEER